MSSFISVEEAQAKLPELIEKLIPGDMLYITKDDRTIARIVKEPPPLLEPRKPGSAIGKILYMADDFDAPLEDFKEYMP